VLLIVALHLGVAAMAASRHLMLAPSSFALFASAACDPQR
jgi:hypothetical protein